MEKELVKTRKIEIKIEGPQERSPNGSYIGRTQEFYMHMESGLPMELIQQKVVFLFQSLTTEQNK